MVVTAASTSDPAGARLLLARLGGGGKKLRTVWVDGTYRGTLLAWVAERYRFRLQAVLRTEEQKGFVVLPRRWGGGADVRLAQSVQAAEQGLRR